MNNPTIYIPCATPPAKAKISYQALKEIAAGFLLAASMGCLLILGLAM